MISYFNIILIKYSFNVYDKVYNFVVIDTIDH